MMRALPLWQPWASLIAIGAKTIETRPKPAPSTILGQRVVIHACLTDRALWRVGRSPFAERLMEALEDGHLAEVDGKLPRGYLLCTAVVAKSQPVTRKLIDELAETRPDELAFGDYHRTASRYAWTLEGLERLSAPVPFKGKQGIFFVPNELVGLPPEPEPVESQGTLL